MKTVQTGKNKGGLTYALVKLNNGNGLVYVKCINYRAGRDVATWRFCNKFKQSGQDAQKMAREGLPFIEAEKMYFKKLQGKKKF